MGVWDSLATPAGQAAIDRLAKDTGCRTTAELNLRTMLLTPKEKIEKLVQRKAWADPRKYDAAVESLSLR
jgi:hypothetical protein